MIQCKLQHKRAPTLRSAVDRESKRVIYICCRLSLFAALHCAATTHLLQQRRSVDALRHVLLAVRPGGEAHVGGPPAVLLGQQLGGGVAEERNETPRGVGHLQRETSRNYVKNASWFFLQAARGQCRGKARSGRAQRWRPEEWKHSRNLNRGLLLASSLGAVLQNRKIKPRVASQTWNT